MNNKGTTLAEFSIISPIFILMIFSFLMLCLFLSERFLLKYAIFQALRKSFVDQQMHSLDEMYFMTNVYQLIHVLPFRKKIEVLSLKKELSFISVSLRVFYFFPLFDKKYCVYEKTSLSMQ